MIQQSVNLRHYNTLRLRCRASYFVEVTDVEQLREAIDFSHKRQLPILFLGEGSNVVLPVELNALVIRIAFNGISIVESTAGIQRLTAAAGEHWDSVVALSTERKLWGLENLSLIPGQVGAAPIQNIGAYGAEFGDHLVSLDLLDIASGRLETLSAEQCQFGYRNSVFKNAYRNKFVILGATFELSQNADPRLGYGGLQNALKSQDLSALSSSEVREAVCRIRRSKLPDPAITPNAGSFFKNPLVSENIVTAIEQEYPELVSFPAADGRKLAAGWLIEQAGFKGKQFDSVGVYKDQALVLTTNGNADAERLLALASDIQQRVRACFGVTLEIEPNCYNQHARLLTEKPN